MPIKGLTEQRRMPRIGKIHLGIKVPTKNNPDVLVPKATNYFVYPEEGASGYDLIEQLKKAYGEKPKSFNIVFAMPDEESVASQYYRCYQRTRGLVCRGDGEIAMRVIDTSTGFLPNKETTDTELQEITCVGRDCPEYQDKKIACREVMNLQFMLPEISGLGIWQIDTSSINSIRNINSCLEAIRAVYKRIDMIPLTLTLEKMEVTPPGEKKKTVHVMNIRSQDTLTEALLKAQKPVWQLIAHDPEQAERDKTELWGEDGNSTKQASVSQKDAVKDFPKEEQERMLSPEEAENRLTPEEIEKAELEENLFPEDKVPEQEPEAELEPEPKPEAKDESKVTPEQVEELKAVMEKLGVTPSDLGSLMVNDKKWKAPKTMQDLMKWQMKELMAIYKKELGG